MSKPVEQVVSDFCDALQPGERFQSFITSAEEEGYPQIAKMFRAIVASETTRERVAREHLPKHVSLTCDYYICPFCGLIYEEEAPEMCPADNTPGDQFFHIQ